MQIGIEQHSIGASVGIAQAGRGHVTVDELLRCAHVALSRARILHTEFCFFDPKMDAHIRERSLLEKDLRAAIGGDGLRPVLSADRRPENAADRQFRESGPLA